jgi:hypothetical protein
MNVSRLDDACVAIHMLGNYVDYRCGDGRFSGVHKLRDNLKTRLDFHQQ